MLLRNRWFHLLMLLVGAGTLGAWLFWSGRSRDTASSSEEASRDWMSRRVSIDIVDQPLEAALALLAEEHGLSFRVDTASLDSLDYSGAERVTLKMKDMPLRGAFFYLPRQCSEDLAVRIDEREIVLTTRVDMSGTQPAPTTRVYPLTGLMENSVGFVPGRLSNLVETVVEAGIALPPTWNATGTEILEELPGSIVVSQTESNHAVIQQLIRVMSVDRGAGVDSFSLDEDDEARRELEDRLEENVSVEFWEASVTHAVEWLGNEYDLPILIDHRALANSGILLDDKLSIRLDDVPIGAALRTMLHDFDLTYVVHHGIAFVTTPDVAEQMVVLRFYPVQDLLLWTGDDWELFVDLLEWNVAPETWGDSADVIEAHASTICVIQHVAVHRQIESFLHQLRHQAYPYLMTPTLSAPAATSADRRIRDALDRTTSLDFEQVPLNYIARTLADDYAINVRLDVNSLNSVGLSPDHCLSTWQRDMPLGTALDRMLAEFDLTASISTRDGVLWITADDDMDMEVQLYSVGDLLPVHNRSNAIQSLGSVIQALIRPELLWEDHGGLGSLEAIQDVLVIRTTTAAHRQINALFNELRWWMQEGKPIAFEFHLDDAGTPTRVYDLGPLVETVVGPNLPREIDLPWYDHPRASGSLLDLAYCKGGFAPNERIADCISLLIRENEDTWYPAPIGVFHDCLIASVSADDHQKIFAALTNLIEADQTSTRPITNSSGDAGSGFVTRTYPVSGLLAKYEDLDVPTLEQLIWEIVQPGSWHRLATDPAESATLPGVLVVRNSQAAHVEIESLVARLTSDSFAKSFGSFRWRRAGLIGLDPPMAFTLDAEAEQVLLAGVGAHDRLHRALSMWMLGRIAEPSERLLEVAINAVEESIKSDDRTLQLVGMSALASWASAKNIVPGVLERMLRHPTISKDPLVRSRAIFTLSLSTSEKAIGVLRNLLQDKSLLTNDELIEILNQMGARAQPAMHDVLLRIHVEGVQKFMRSLDKVDPHGVRTREILTEWKRSDDESLRQISNTLDGLLQYQVWD